MGKQAPGSFQIARMSPDIKPGRDMAINVRGPIDIQLVLNQGLDVAGQRIATLGASALARKKGA